MSFVNNIDAAVEALTHQIKLLKEKADDSIPVVMKMEVHKHCWDAMNFQTKQLFQHNKGWSNWVDFTTANEYQMKLLSLMQGYKAACDIHESKKDINSDAIKNNIKVKEKVASIMKHMGVPGTYSTSEYKTSRSRKLTTTTHQAGWMGDMHRCVPTMDNWSKIKGEMDTKIREIEAFAKQKITELATVEKKQDKELAEKALINYATTLKIKYNLDYELTVGEVHTEISTGKCGAEHDEFTKLKELLDKVKELQ